MIEGTDDGGAGGVNQQTCADASPRGETRLERRSSSFGDADTAAFAYPSARATALSKHCLTAARPAWKSLLAAFAGRSAFICLRTQLGRAPDKLAVASARRYQAAQGERAAPLTRDCTGQNRAVVGQRPGKADRDKARRPKQPLASIKMELVGSGVEEASHLEASLGYSRILRVCIELEQRGHLATRGLLNLQGQLR